MFYKGRKLVFQEKGFSLLEIIFSAGIISVATVSMLLLFGYNLRTSIDNKNKLIATYLAQEAIEIVRQHRDNNLFHGTGWNQDFGDTEGNEVVSVLNDNDDIRKGWKIKKVDYSWEKKVYKKTGQDYYVQSETDLSSVSGWKYTGFERVLRIRENDSSGTVSGCLDAVDCMEVTSYVYFNGVEIAKVTTYLYGGWY